MANLKTKINKAADNIKKTLPVVGIGLMPLGLMTSCEKEKTPTEQNQQRESRRELLFNFSIDNGNKVYKDDKVMSFDDSISEGFEHFQRSLDTLKKPKDIKDIPNINMAFRTFVNVNGVVEVHSQTTLSLLEILMQQQKHVRELPIDQIPFFLHMNFLPKKPKLNIIYTPNMFNDNYHGLVEALRAYGFDITVETKSNSSQGATYCPPEWFGDKGSR
jgi:hypothetical protein